MTADPRPTPPDLPPDGPTELVENERGELVERLSSGTATLLLIWLVGVGGLSTLFAAWLFVWLVSGERLGVDALFGGFGLYTGLAGAAGPCVLWLTGRAQGHRLAWFVFTAAKIGLVMIAIVVGVVLVATLVLAGRLPSPGAAAAVGLMVAMALPLTAVWGLATWGADRWIAGARTPAPDA
jgi:hypothetical protein